MNLQVPHRVLIGWLASATMLAGCERETALAPPDIRYGEDICAECGMIVSDDRFAAALIQDGQTDRETLLFDDVGCLLRRSVSPGTPEPLAQFVRDAEGGGWLEMNQASFVQSASMETPMGFGIAAFRSSDAAQMQGDPLDWKELMRRFSEESAQVNRSNSPRRRRVTPTTMMSAIDRK